MNAFSFFSTCATNMSQGIINIFFFNHNFLTTYKIILMNRSQEFFQRTIKKKLSKDCFFLNLILLVALKINTAIFGTGTMAFVWRNFPIQMWWIRLRLIPVIQKCWWRRATIIRWKFGAVEQWWKHWVWMKKISIEVLKCARDKGITKVIATLTD